MPARGAGAAGGQKTGGQRSKENRYTGLDKKAVSKKDAAEEARQNPTGRAAKVAANKIAKKERAEKRENDQDYQARKAAFNAEKLGKQAAKAAQRGY